MNRFELIFKLGYENIKRVGIDNDSYVRIDYNKKVNGKTHSRIKICKEHKEKVSLTIIQLFREVLDIEH